MFPFRLFFLVFSLVCFLIAAWMPTSPVWNRMMALGSACAVAASFVV